MLSNNKMKDGDLMEKTNSKTKPLIKGISKIISAILGAAVSGLFTYYATTYSSNKQIEKYQMTVSTLQIQIDGLRNESGSNSLSSEPISEINSSDDSKNTSSIISENSTPESSNTSSKNNPNNIDSDQSESPTNMVAVAYSNENACTFYSGPGNTGFSMFGEKYNNGFMIRMGASFNMWGEGTQYITYIISSVTKKYTKIKMLVGHVDGYVSNDIKLRIFLDKTLDETPNYEYTISPNVAPQWITINAKNTSAMTIEVSNLGSGTNCIGFTDVKFK